MRKSRSRDLTIRRTARRISIVTLLLASSALGAQAYDQDEKVRQFFGLAEFEREWVPASSLTLFDGQEPPASPSIWDGLGPLHSETRCAACHVGPALAGRFVSTNDEMVSAVGLVVRLGDESGAPDPHYGEQIQTRATEGVIPEARVSVFTPDVDGERYEVSLDLLRGALSNRTLYAPLAAPPLVGRGEIERVDPNAIERLAALQAASDDSVSGQVHWIDTPNGPMVGRFGHKSEHPDLMHQVSFSFWLEMGVSNRIYPSDYGDCTSQQADCLAVQTSENTRRGGVEISDDEISLVLAYLMSLKAPAQLESGHIPNTDFMSAGCGSCHVPTLPTVDGDSVVLYSDLLLHDMGPDFDNGIGAHGLAPSLWRTTPLLALAPYSGRRYLHDGRAQTLDAAIRAHGGEAEESREAYERLSPDSRAALIVFLEGL